MYGLKRLVEFRVEQLLLCFAVCVGVTCTLLAQGLEPQHTFYIQRAYLMLLKFGVKASRGRYEFDLCHDLPLRKKNSMHSQNCPETNCNKSPTDLN